MTKLNYTINRFIKLDEAQEIIAKINWELLQNGYVFTQTNHFDDITDNDFVDFVATWQIKNLTIAESVEPADIINKHLNQNDQKN